MRPVTIPTSFRPAVIRAWCLWRLPATRAPGPAPFIQPHLLTCWPWAAPRWAAAPVRPAVTATVRAAFLRGALHGAASMPGPPALGPAADYTPAPAASASSPRPQVAPAPLPTTIHA